MANAVEVGWIGVMANLEVLGMNLAGIQLLGSELMSIGFGIALILQILEFVVSLDSNFDQPKLLVSKNVNAKRYLNLALWVSIMLSVGNVLTITAILGQFLLDPRKAADSMELKSAKIEGKKGEKKANNSKLKHGWHSILDSTHSLHNVAIYSVCLGLVSGLGCLLASYRIGLGYFIMMVGLFHELEYYTTAKYQPARTSLSSFLLDHSPEFNAAMGFATVEFLFESWLSPSFKSFGYINFIGFIVAIIGQILRSLAMITAGKNFNHNISTVKEDGHELVTNGIYQWLRHPSYTGFFYWGLGLQLMMLNPIAFAGYFYALQDFFSHRIPIEEEYLIDFYGNEYREYRGRTYVLIPLKRV